MLHLPDVTLVTIDDVAHDLARAAMEECLKRAKFGDVLVLSDREIMPGARHVKINAGNSLNWSRLLWYELPNHVNTSHFLLIEWDSWIINQNAWTDEFLRHDYIGAPWPHRKDEHCVGNGGFSLRSMRLANAVKDCGLQIELPEDHFLCREYRGALEQAGCRWAPRELAEKFSAELKWPHDSIPFGFHGAFNWPRVLTRGKIFERLSMASDYVRKSKQMAYLDRVFPL
jgi:hypothetical protein